MTAEAISLWLLIAGSAIFGLLIGSFLNVVIWRVPRGESIVPASRCPHCQAQIRPYQNVPVISWLALRGRCATCEHPISARYPLVEAGTAIAFGLITWWVAATLPTPENTRDLIAWWLTLAAYLWFGAASIALAAIDFVLQRLPDRIVLPSLLVVGFLLAVASIITGNWGRLASTVGAAIALFALYFVIVLVYPKGMGGGDVKLAPLIGAVLGFIGWGALAVGAFAGFAFGAIWGLLGIVRGRAGRKSAIPFGPFMLLGAWVGAIWGEFIWAAYLGAVGIA